MRNKIIRIALVSAAMLSFVYVANTTTIASAQNYISEEDALASNANQNNILSPVFSGIDNAGNDTHHGTNVLPSVYHLLFL